MRTYIRVPPKNLDYKTLPLSHISLYLDGVSLIRTILSAFQHVFELVLPFSIESTILEYTN